MHANHLPDNMYTESAAQEILDRLMTGESLTSICKDPLLPARSVVARWISNNVEGFTDRYASARDVGLDVMADELLNIADDGSHDTYEDSEGRTRVDQEIVQRSRLRVDTRKWYLAKLAPKRYGDRLAVEHDVSDSLADQLRKARERSGSEDQ